MGRLVEAAGPSLFFNMTTRNVDGKSFTFSYDAENRLVSVTGDSTATFTFNGDGQRVKSIMDGETTLFVGGHYEVTNPGAGQTVTKYYMAGATRVAVRKGGTLSYMLADHLGSTSLVTDANGNRTSELRYKPWGETRFSFGTMPTKYTFTGQFSYTDDPSTEEVTEGFGLMYYNARWLDAELGRFSQADTIIPGGVQGYDRYAYTNNNPVRYTDPTGHMLVNGSTGCRDEMECILQAQDEEILDEQEDKKKCKAGENRYCSGWSNGTPRSIMGVHFGTSIIMDVFVGNYTYEQTDYLFDWKTGTFYKTITNGSGTYVGGLNGGAIEFYAGTSNVHGIPSSATPEQVNGYLSGPNFDLAGDVGLDVADFDGSVGKGLSVDLDSVSGDPMVTSAGEMYTTENKIGGGMSVLPFPINGGAQWGNSYTTSSILFQIPWWPFK